MSEASPFSGLGTLHSKFSKWPNGTTPQVDDTQEAFERGVQRVVPAAGAPSVIPPNAVTSAFAHPYRPAGGNPAQRKEKSMAQDEGEGKPRRTRATKGTSARFQICALLLAKGDLTRDELLEDVSANRTQFNQAIFYAKQAEHIVFIAKTDKWHLTAAGKAWTSGGANLDNHKSAAASQPPVRKSKPKPKAEPKQRKKPKARRGAIRVHRGAKAAPAPEPQPQHLAIAHSGPQPIQVIQERSFRCAVISDGGFFLHKGDKQIDLTAAEHREMLNYIDRVRGVDAPEPGRS